MAIDGRDAADQPKAPDIGAALAAAAMAAQVRTSPGPAAAAAQGAEDASLSLDGTALAPLDRVLPAKPGPFIALVVGVSVVTWLLGLALTPDRAKLLASPEWRFMPLYLAAHLVSVRLFVWTYTHNFRNGVKHLNVGTAAALRGVRTVLGPAGLGLAILIAAPFCYLDFQYLAGTDTRYVRLGGAEVAVADYLMWGTWAVEWVLNALIWVMLVGFLIKNCVMIQTYPFRAPIEIAVHEKHYKPFLQMSSKGASILLGFSAVTIAHLWYTGGELTDYAGLSITAALLLIGFLPSWVLLRRKVRTAVEGETQALRHTIAAALWRDQKARQSGATVRAPIEQRLDEALAIFRITHLEQMKLNLGSSEARAITLRLMAPLLGIVWQLSQNFQNLSAHFGTTLQTIKATLGKWGL